jgi:uncharacterized protein (DUF58 family)
VALMGFVLMAVGRLLGTDGLMQVGFGLVFVVLAAVVVVRLGGHELAVDRDVSPQRVRTEQPVTVSLTLTNNGSARAPLLMLEERLPSGLSRNPRFTLMGLEVGGSRTITYEVRPPKRGRYEVGPLEVTLADPFGLARARSSDVVTATFLVHPRIDRLGLARDLGHHRSLAVSAIRQPSGSRGEDFYTLREYVEGDDLRKIHWTSTAKRGKYMIRQEEIPWHTRLTIVIDDRAAAHCAPSFERTVEASASLANLYHRCGYSFRLTGAHHAGTPPGRGPEHYLYCLDLLSMIGTQPEVLGTDALVARLSELRLGSRVEGTLVAVCGKISAEAATALAACRRRFKDVVAIMSPPHRYAPLIHARDFDERALVEVTTLLARSGIGTIVLGPRDSLATAWSSPSPARWAGASAQWEPKPEHV